jgi:hypothetical protein
MHNLSGDKVIIAAAPMATRLFSTPFLAPTTGIDTIVDAARKSACAKGSGAMVRAQQCPCSAL